MYDSPWGFHKNRPCKLTFALLPGRRESGSRIPRPVPLHYRPCKQNKHGACCCLSVTSCHLSVWVQVSLLAFFLQTLAKETMVYCFSSDCRHHQENYKCRFFRFPSDATKRNQWLRLCRWVKHVVLLNIFCYPIYKHGTWRVFIIIIIIIIITIIIITIIIIPWITWNLSFRYIHYTGQFTPKMKANAVPRLLTSLVWIDQYNEM